MKAIIFDLDGTIVVSHPTHFAAYEKLFGEFGVKWNYEEFNSIFAGTGAPSIIELILKRNGIKDFNRAALVRKKRDLFQSILDGKKLSVVPGFYDFLKKINEAGLKKAIASGSNRQNIIGMLENIGVLEEFAEIVSGEDVTNPKPAPDIFLAAAEKLGVPPAECLVIEDMDHGVAGALAAGMKCIALTTTIGKKRLREAGARTIVKNYKEIDPILLQSKARRIKMKP